MQKIENKGNQIALSWNARVTYLFFMLDLQLSNFQLTFGGEFFAQKY